MVRTVLIVDDEPQLLRLLIRVFDREGYQVLSAQDGEEAIELFHQHMDEIDVLVLDVVIPPSGAVAVLDDVLPRKPGLGLVLASGDRLEDTLSDVVRAQGGIFVRKPFLPKNLVRVVGEMCDSVRAAACGDS